MRVDEAWKNGSSPAREGLSVRDSQRAQLAFRSDHQDFSGRQCHRLGYRPGWIESQDMRSVEEKISSWGG